MPEYVPPLADIRFVLAHVVDMGGLTALEAFGHADPATVDSVIEEAGKFMADVLAPLNRIGDTVGSHLETDGGLVTRVVTPPGFKDAYARYVEAGWGAIPFDPVFGGGGFPWLVTIVLQEMLTSANMSFSLCPLLTQGAIDMLAHHGSPQQQDRYLSRMVTGEWTGTMNLTEPEAGSDVGALRARATPAEDGTWRISGQKIFITYGDHDLADNVIHLVLARVPDAPPGTRGISCFIVPKFLVNDDGTLGPRNDVRCVSLEHKMGIHGSPTCVMSYGDQGGAVGYLINAGMRYMFTLMNTARLSVGVEGIAIAERAYQQAVAFARERKQGHAVGAPAGAQSAIIEHPDVRRMLLTIHASTLAMRRLIYLNAESVDLARHHPDPEIRRARQELVELLTPVSKAWCTDVGVEMASLAIQVHGGMGYIEETGVAQLLRDGRIAPIYEGTNGIQAIDLVSRKLPMRGGAVVREFLDAISREADALAATELASIQAQLRMGVDALAVASEWLLEHGKEDPNVLLAAAGPYLKMFGLVTGGWLMARSAAAALKHGPPDVLVTARFYAEQLLPQAGALIGAVTAGPRDLFAVDFS
jgi:alkylation response protein AidB-like acyl-CoA dehydrogenase